MLKSKYELEEILTGLFTKRENIRKMREYNRTELIIRYLNKVEKGFVIDENHTEIFAFFNIIEELGECELQKRGKVIDDRNDLNDEEKNDKCKYPYWIGEYYFWSKLYNMAESNPFFDEYNTEDTEEEKKEQKENMRNCFKKIISLTSDERIIQKLVIMEVMSKEKSQIKFIGAGSSSVAFKCGKRVIKFGRRLQEDLEYDPRYVRMDFRKKFGEKIWLEVDTLCLDVTDERILNIIIDDMKKRNKEWEDPRTANCGIEPVDARKDDKRRSGNSPIWWRGGIDNNFWVELLGFRPSGYENYKNPDHYVITDVDLVKKIKENDEER